VGRWGVRLEPVEAVADGVLDVVVDADLVADLAVQATSAAVHHGPVTGVLVHLPDGDRL
jgi:hypothetical protein